MLVSLCVPTFEAVDAKVMTNSNDFSDARCQVLVLTCWTLTLGQLNVSNSDTIIIVVYK